MLSTRYRWRSSTVGSMLVSGCHAERELCEMFQTSRGTLREALRILEQKSLIEIRLGVNGGAYVKDANGELMAENLAMLIRSQTISLSHLAEFREGIEGSVAGLAAQRASAGDIKKLIFAPGRSGRFSAGQVPAAGMILSV